MLVWDKDREDWSGFTPTAVPNAVNIRQPSVTSFPGKENDSGSFSGERLSSGPDSTDKSVPVINTMQPGGGPDIVVSRPAPVDKKGQGTAKFNPISHWRVSKKAINGMLCEMSQNSG